MPTILIMMLMKMGPWSEDKPSTYTPTYFPTTPIKKRKLDWTDFVAYGLLGSAFVFGVVALLTMIIGFLLDLL